MVNRWTNAEIKSAAETGEAMARAAQREKDGLVGVAARTADVVDPDKLAGGYKADENKVRMDLIPPEVPHALAAVLTFGANKYTARNWEKGMWWGRPFAACMRHLWAWWGGKGPTTKSFLFGDLDAETGFSHLWHALCCLAFLTAYEERGMTQWDDRFKAGEIAPK